MSAQTFKPLPLSSLGVATGYQHPYYFSVNPVRVGSSALEVMTDLKYMPAATIGGLVDIEETTQVMIARGVRLLLVVNELQHVIGLITARDLHGDRYKAAAEKAGTGSLPVSRVMTPCDAVEVLRFKDVLHAHVGDIIETLKGSGRQHALVVDDDALSGQQKVRGIFSASQIARQLGISTVVSFDLAGTFAELDRHLQRAG